MPGIEMVGRGKPCDTWAQGQGNTEVYDNNGIETGNVPTNYYNGVAGGAGAWAAYSMSNNYDLIYAGYVDITSATSFTSLTAYFAVPGIWTPLNPANPNIQYHMNLWSNVSGDLLPANTGSFEGDVFTSDNTPGVFSWSDTSCQLIGEDGMENDIYRLVYTLGSPMTLEPGIYWYSSDASISPVVPEPISVIFLGTGLVAVGGYITRRRMQRN